MSFRTFVCAFPVPSGPFAGFSGVFQRSARHVVQAG
jgi:hypothetical protein